MYLLFHYSHPLKILIQSLENKKSLPLYVINIHFVRVIHPTFCKFVYIYIYLLQINERLNVRFSSPSNSLFFFNLNIRSTRCCGEIACSIVCTQITRQADIIDVHARLFSRRRPLLSYPIPSTCNSMFQNRTMFRIVYNRSND